jgi:adiponectin receptor
MACDEVQDLKMIWTCVMGVGCAICFVITLLPDCDKARCRPAKGIMFIVMGLSTASVIGYLGVENPMQLKVQWQWYALGGAIYIMGAIMYVLRIPERWKPGAFDLCGASHQLFHVCVLAGCLIHYTSNYNLFFAREKHFCPIRTYIEPALAK